MANGCSGGSARTYSGRLGGMCGGIGGMLMLLVAGGMLQWLGNFTLLFIFAGVMHPLAWIAIRALVGKNIAQIDLDKGLKGSVAAAAGGAAAASLLALMGLAGLREPRSSARCRPSGGVIGRDRHQASVPV